MQKEKNIQLKCHSPLIRTSSTFPLDGEGSPSTWRGRAECVSTGVRGKRAFTLIELLVVVLIIGILAAIAVPQYQKAMWKSRAAQLQLAVKQAGKSADFYRLTNGTNPTQFSDLDLKFTLPIKRNTSGICGNVVSSQDAHQENNQFQLVLNYFTADYQAVNAAFITGRYRCGGFVYMLKDYSTILKAGEEYCVELAVMETRVSPAGNFCEKVIGATYLATPALLGWRYYKMP